jgi:hypothetical protein
LQSAFERHATQALVAALHCGLAASLQSVLSRHPTQVFGVVEVGDVSQTVFVGSLQSALVTHSTQVFVPVLHAGLAAE